MTCEFSVSHKRDRKWQLLDVNDCSPLRKFHLVLLVNEDIVVGKKAGKKWDQMIAI